MTEIVNDQKILSLSEVSLSIKKTISEKFNGSYWIRGEMIKLNFHPSSGHCYPELIETENGEIISHVTAFLWNDDYQKINNKFQLILSEPLKDGIKILFCTTIMFDPILGLSFRIIDIDTNYSLGELETKKQETIEKLKNENLFSKNKEIQLADLPKRIAIISDATSQGYSDFTKMLNSNSSDYNFFHMLFPNLLQGEKAISEIITQLHKIRKIIAHFDVVAIVRGAGNDAGLTCFNDYLLSKEVALFPIPVMSGIGHSTNETIVEMVSYMNAATPTDLAGAFIQKFHDYLAPLKRAEESIMTKSKHLINDEKSKLKNIEKYSGSIFQNDLIKNKNQIQENSGILLKELNPLHKKEKEAFYQYSTKLFKELSPLLKREKEAFYHYSTKLSKELSPLLKREKEAFYYYSTELQKGSIGSLKTAKNDLKELILKMKKNVISNINESNSYIKQYLSAIPKALGKLFAQKTKTLSNYYFNLFK